MAKKGKALPKQHVTRRRLARWQQEKRRRRFYVSAGIAIIVLILGIIIYGVYTTNISMAGNWVTTVGGTRFVGTDYADALHLCQMGFFSSNSSDPMEAPILLLERDEVVKQGAAELHITVNDSEVTAEIRAAIEGNQSLSDEEFQQAYQESLQGMELTEEQFTELIGNSLLQQKLHEHILSSVPDVGENTTHVYLELLITINESQLTEVQAFLSEGMVLADLMGNYTYEDYGWIPQGILMPEMEKVAFNLSIGNISDPIQAGSSYYFIQVTGKEERPLQQEMRDEIEYNALPRWFMGESASKVQRNPDLNLEKMYNWALAQIGG